MNMSLKPKVVVIAGPTATGKTATALELADHFGAHIVGADSMQIYRYLDIGTAKPDRAERARIPHYMIDIVDPDADFSAGQYATMSGEVIDDLRGAGRIPFIVGGTGLYIKACLYGLLRSHAADSTVLDRLSREATAKGAAVMHERLRRADPEAARRINPGDTFRVVRALELLETTGRPASEHARAHGFSESRYQALKICLYQDREKLYRRINHRVEMMLAQGLVEEVRSLLDRGYSPRLKSMQSIGYRHVTQYLEKKLSWEELVRTMQQDTRRYAKRQLTWFRADPDIHWVDIKEGLEKSRNLIKTFLGIN
ncbi:MAG: tRNA (adenosine(37)-N6)-dimethylallyltransferase MiaA [Desulfosudaceae bacterium]